MRRLKLYNGIEIPEIGFGTWHIKDEKELEFSIKTAVENGYTHIDTASKYKNEELIGNTIEKYNIPREKLFITSKLWNEDKGYDNTIKAFQETLDRLKTDYLDLYLIHWPMTADNWEELNAETWRAFEDLYKMGKVKAIGVSNFMIQHMESLRKTANIFPMVDQIEFHPGMMQKEILEYCRNNNIVVEAWSPLGFGRMLDNEDLKRIADKYKKSVAQICVRWCVQNNVIPLPKSTHLERIKDNIDIYDFIISDEDMEYINNMEYFAGSGLTPNKIFP
ncbi:MAG: oxidoreductase [Clostridium sp. 28_12]|nr:MAG: oxidoreductase [Clostridium sp. 28_12]